MKNHKTGLVATLGLCVLLTGCKQGLLTGLDQRQANEVLAALQRNNISASKEDKGKTGYDVDVDKSDFVAAVDLLKTYNLPSGPRVQIDKQFPADSLVSSPQAEKARLTSAIEQRLEQSLSSMNHVVSAHVDVSYDTNSADDNDKQAPMHVSALLVYEQGTDPQALISDVKRFLKNSFSDIDYDNISVVVNPRPPMQHVAPDAPRQHGGIAIGGALAALLGLFAGVGAWWYRKRKIRESYDV
ncbi:EscJ/YscJ/HrcJ family type III secretion inner membrane ring protein [Paludibacterium paludis]|uniref:Lipoprotein n=1 Tax=Paludibacterium paludis TaxID=1225769 RepID=A0A918P608_9NEIS|nr:EscJ/YscJ/HrcJ family type III secretion inner membrane ring protein [Paludibacterium paludis]GGY23882.1 EscJ/YscJ/HrcJ family type III secretion inner membrane ring protein [Paludibacterium paludis]